MTPPRYLKAAERGLSRVRLYRATNPTPMRLAHAELKAGVTARIQSELVRHNALPPAPPTEVTS